MTALLFPKGRVSLWTCCQVEKRKQEKKTMQKLTIVNEIIFFVSIPCSRAGGRKTLPSVTQFPIRWMAPSQVLWWWWEEDRGQSDLALGLHFRSLVLCEAKYLGARCSRLPLRTPASVFCPIRPGLFVRFRLERGFVGFYFFSFCYWVALFVCFGVNPLSDVWFVGRLLHSVCGPPVPLTLACLFTEQEYFNWVEPHLFILFTVLTVLFSWKSKPSLPSPVLWLFSPSLV